MAAGNPSDIALKVALQIETEQALQQVRDFADKAGVSMKDAFNDPTINQSIKDNFSGKVFDDLNEGFNKVTQNAKGLGSVLNGVVGQAATWIAGFFAVNKILSEFIQFLQEATQAAIEFSQALFAMDVAIRTMQKGGMDTSIEAWRGEIKKLKEEMPALSETEITKNVSNMAMWLREMNLTQDQIFSLTETALAFSVATGKNFDDISRAIALAFEGNTRYLARLGFNITPEIIHQEALALGIDKVNSALTDQERKMVILSIVMKNTDEYLKDAVTYEQTLAGETKQLGASWTDFGRTVGQALAPLEMEILPGLIFLINALTKDFQTFSLVFKLFAAETTFIRDVWAKALSDYLTNLITLFKSISTGTFLQEIKRLIVETLNLPKTLKEMMLNAGQKVTDAQLKNAPIGSQEEVDTKNVDAQKKAADDITTIMKDSADQQAKIAQNLQDDLAKITREGVDKRSDIERKYQDKLDDITRHTADKVAKAYRDYQQQQVDDQTTANNEKDDKLKKHLDDELKAQEDYNLRIKQMTENFQLSLEDAIRTVDVRGARKLYQKFNLDKKQETDKYNLEKIQRDRAFELEMADIDAQAQRKKKADALTLQQKLADITAEADQERRDASIQRDQDLREQRIAEANQRRDRMIAFNQQMRDLVAQIKAKLALVKKGLEDEIKLNQEAVTKINAIQANKKVVGTAGGHVGIPSTGGHASGGSFLATSPVTGLFGEAGAELVSSIPLSQLMSGHNYSMGSDIAGVRQPSKVIIGLQPGLTASIVDTTLGKIAEIQISVEQGR